MSLPYRHNFKWNVNELLSLQREYELLEMTIQDISDKHDRTIVAILYRLQEEGFIESWIDARGYQEFAKTQKYLVGSLYSGVNAYDYEEDVVNNKMDVVNETDSDYEEDEEVNIETDNGEDSDYEEDEDEEDYTHDNNISSLSQRVWGLESAVSDIKNMIGTLISRISTQTKPLKKLRQTQTQVSEEI